MKNNFEQIPQQEKNEKEEKMEYPDFENLTISEKIGANLYDVFEGELEKAVKEFEQAGLKIGQLVEHTVEEENYSHKHYYVVVEWEKEKK